MAGFGEAASIAGLISLTGQTMQALSTLYGFVKSYREVHLKIGHLVDQLEGLKACLSQIQEAAAQAAVAPTPSTVPLVSISGAVHRCQLTMNELQGILDPLKSTLRRDIGKRLKVAADKSFFSNIHQRLSAHIEDLTLLLNAAGWRTGLQTLNAVQQLKIIAMNLQSAELSSTASLSSHLNDITNSLQDTTSIAASNAAMMHAKLDTLLENRSANTMTERQIVAIETRIAQMQLQLQRSIANHPRHNKPPVISKARRKLRIRVSARLRNLETVGISATGSCQKNLDNVKPVELPMRLIKPVYLLSEDHGRIRVERQAIEDPDFSKLSLREKRSIMQYLQNLRLLLWLFRSDNYVTAAYRPITTVAHSALGKEGALGSWWRFQNAYSSLGDVLSRRFVDLVSAVPWLKCKHWLQYLFDRVQDGEGDGEILMEMVIRQWSRFPVPDRYTKGTYLIQVPRRLLEIQAREHPPPEEERPFKEAIRQSGGHESFKVLAKQLLDNTMPVGCVEDAKAATAVAHSESEANVCDERNPDVNSSATTTKSHLSLPYESVCLGYSLVPHSRCLNHWHKPLQRDGGSSAIFEAPRGSASLPQTAVVPDAPLNHFAIDAKLWQTRFETFCVECGKRVGLQLKELLHPGLPLRGRTVLCPACREQFGTMMEEMGAREPEWTDEMVRKLIGPLWEKLERAAVAHPSDSL